jgi:hypothetical protein
MSIQTDPFLQSWSELAKGAKGTLGPCWGGTNGSTPVPSEIKLLTTFDMDGKAMFYVNVQGSSLGDFDDQRAALTAARDWIASLRKEDATTSTDGRRYPTLTSAILEAFVISGYDRDASHDSERYVGYRYGLGFNANRINVEGLGQSLAEEIARVAGFENDDSLREEAVKAVKETSIEYVNWEDRVVRASLGDPESELSDDHGQRLAEAIAERLRSLMTARAQKRSF